jgi:4-hydroxy-tetrahydrodipicolinate reductase
MAKLRIAVSGGRGRTGQFAIRAVYEDEGAALSGVLIRPGSIEVGQPVAIPDTSLGTGLAYSGDPGTVFDVSDAVIDFSAPTGSLALAKAAAKTGKALVIGTTGFSEAELAEIRRAAKTAPILISYNMSLGIAAIAAVLQPLAGALGKAFHLHITDIHHEKKTDKPSGTSLLLAEASGRPKAEVMFTSVREGDAIGEHQILFSGPAEQVEIIHRAKDRRLYAEGALLAAHWLVRQKPGLYTFNDVLKAKP